MQESVRPLNPPIRLRVVSGQRRRGCSISHEFTFPFFSGVSGEPTLEIERMSIFEG